MTEYTYKQVLGVAKACQANIKKEYKLGVTSKWSYFFAKAILQPNKVYNQFNYPASPQPHGDYLSRQISISDCLDCCKRLVKYVETNKRMPNYIAWKNFKISPALFTEVLSRVLIYLDTHKTLPKYANINSKVFKEETETTNTVYDYFVKKTGIKPKMLDDVCDWVIKKVNYQFYFDDQKSNKEVIDSRSGNCTDLLQFLVNMAIALGYDYEVIHTQCKVSGTGHVYGRFKKKGTNDWFVRDIACISDESRYCVWCEVPNKGNLLAKNPQWFLNNLNR